VNAQRLFLIYTERSFLLQGGDNQFHVNSTRHCDACQCDVKIGLGGESNWNAHIKSAAHRKSERAAKIITKDISSFFTKATPKPTASLPVASSLPLLSSHGQAEFPRTSPESHTSRETDSVVESSCLLTELARIAQTLPSSIPLAVPTDALAAYSGDPRMELDTDDDPWEMVDRTLNRTLGYGKTTSEIAALIRRGPLGIDGMVNWLRRAVFDLKINESLLEHKVRRLIDAMISL
jgi:hypothetical protein